MTRPILNNAFRLIADRDRIPADQATRRLRMVGRSALALAALIFHFVVSQQSRAASFTNTGVLKGARAGHAATLLPTGNVLVLGGYNGHGPKRLASAELYDRALGTWTNTSPLRIGRTRPTATLLPNGRVLVAAGHDSDTSSTATCELYDPTSGTWTNTGAMASARGWHTGTLLLNGKVLVTAGNDRGGGHDLSTAELHDPATGTWAPTGSLATARDNHTATLLFDGRVLVAGGAPDGGASGSSLSSAELYDSVTGTWRVTGSMISPRHYHTATSLPDGRVLVTGGDSNGSATSSAELYDPATGAWKATGALRSARTIHTATLLSDGKVLVAGGLSGVNASAALSSAEVYDPATGSWTMTGLLEAARDGHTATLLPNGNVLIAGGYDPAASVWLSTAELHDSSPGRMTLASPMKLPNGAIQFAFSGAPHGAFTVLVTTDVLGCWAFLLGVVPEFSPGLFLFSDSSEVRGSERFYKIMEGVPQWYPGAGPYPSPRCPGAFECIIPTGSSTGNWRQVSNCNDPCQF